MSRKGNIGLFLLTSLTLPLLLAGPARAEPVSSVTGGQNQQDGSFFAGAGAREITWDESRNGSGSSVGPLRSTSTAWSPPPCWYAPRWNPEELREVAERIWDPSTQRGTAASALGWMWRHYDGGDPYEDFNSEEAGNGMWWGAVQNPNEPDILERMSCSNIPFWVETGEVPDVEGALSPLILAELAYERIRVPDTNITLSPEREDRQVVNLPTWIWADAGDFSPVAVTASLDGWGIWATTTARPVALTIDPGTADADLFPRSGRCPINEDGSVGTPYTAGRSGDDPPCGLTYRRATHHVDSYPMTASIAWEVSWEGSGGTGDTLPAAVFDTTHDIEVMEVQAVVR
ncbi:hypothetical protein [Streptomyces alkaliphilus]|uniref:hypothetical protein n=1 Tax=Streptomyces alkaliphilus TaxID=1472722 RepID=UPI0012958B48|nr:hypothetical protein [Streptomyces alkaliphilus]